MKRGQKDFEFVPQSSDDFDTDENSSFLSKNGKEIWELESKGVKPLAIAHALCARGRLPKNAVTAKQVSNWISYQKRSGKHPTRKVSLQNNNLRPEGRTDCMLK